MNPNQSTPSSPKSSKEIADSQAGFEKVFNKYSAFTHWADSSSDDDLFDGGNVDVSADIHYRNEQFSEIEEPAYERNEFVQRNETLLDEECFEESFDYDVDVQDNGTNTNNTYFFQMCFVLVTIRYGAQLSCQSSSYPALF